MRLFAHQYRRVAIAAAISFLGAKPIFVDVNLDQNINTLKIEKNNNKKNKSYSFCQFYWSISRF